MCLKGEDLMAYAREDDVERKERRVRREEEGKGSGNEERENKGRNAGRVKGIMLA